MIYEETEKTKPWKSNLHTQTRKNNYVNRLSESVSTEIEKENQAWDLTVQIYFKIN